KFEEFPGGGEEYRHIESLVFSSTSWGGRVVLSSSVSLLPFLLHGLERKEETTASHNCSKEGTA
uniref:Uncharacterized protein n=1 Tax=Aegilops tauschii subsp. strangulata TaxID=200361 RepID=A0A453IGD2_AEGTS